MSDVKWGLRDLRLDEVTIELTSEQDDTPVRGNVLASGDDAVDKAAEDEILERLGSGDHWAWAAVTVRVRWNGFCGEDHLGGCTYKDEAEFRACDYQNMVQCALMDLNNNLQSLYRRLQALEMKNAT